MNGNSLEYSYDPNSNERKFINDVNGYYQKSPCDNSLGNSGPRVNEIQNLSNLKGNIHGITLTKHSLLTPQCHRRENSFLQKHSNILNFSPLQNKRSLDYNLRSEKAALLNNSPRSERGSYGNTRSRKR